MGRIGAGPFASYRRTSMDKTRVANRASSGVSSATRARVAGLFKEAKAMYAPGGEYMKGIEAQLERGGKKAVATGMQGLAAAGLGGTSMMGGLGLKYEEDVATPARSQATTARLSALSGLLQAEAGATVNLATRYSTSPGASYGGGGGGGGYAPARATSARRPSTTQQPTTRKVRPTLSAFSSLFGQNKRTSGRFTPTGDTGYKGVYFGKAFYNLPAAEQRASVSGL